MPPTSSLAAPGVNAPEKRTFVTMVAFLGCALFVCAESLPESSTLADHAEEDIKASAARVFVTSGSIPPGRRYRVLGEVGYSESWTADSVDTMREKLRRVALARFGDEVDAVINAKSDFDAEGTEIRVSGQAVRFGSAADLLENKLCTTTQARGMNCDAGGPRY